MRIKQQSLLLAILAAFLTIGCAGKIDKVFKNGGVADTYPKVTSSVYKKKSHTFKYDSLTGSELQLTYLGSGGFIIERDGSSLMIDPYFSHQNFFKLALSKLLFMRTLKTKTAIADTALSNFKGKVNSIWVSHAHYDHLMDVPYVYSKYALDSAAVYCSQSGVTNLENVEAVRKVIVLDSSNISYTNHVAEPFYLDNRRVKVTPILADHAPHFGSIKFYKGNAKKSKKHYKDPTSRSRAEMWKEGLTFSFVFDFLDKNENIEFRIFSQSSATNPTIGYMPDSLKKEHKVNLAIIGEANFSNANYYPCRLIEDNLNPDYIVICHWEDFFRAYDKAPEKTVRATKLKDFLQVLNKVYPYKTAEGIEKFILPKPGAIISIVKNEKP